MFGFKASPVVIGLSAKGGAVSTTDTVCVLVALADEIAKGTTLPKGDVPHADDPYGMLFHLTFG